MYGVHVKKADSQKHPVWITYMGSNDDDETYVMGTMRPTFPFLTRERAVKALVSYEESHPTAQVTCAQIYKLNLDTLEPEPYPTPLEQWKAIQTLDTEA